MVSACPPTPPAPRDVLTPETAASSVPPPDPPALPFAARPDEVVTAGAGGERIQAVRVHAALLARAARTARPPEPGRLESPRDARGDHGRAAARRQGLHRPLPAEHALRGAAGMPLLLGDRGVHGARRVGTRDRRAGGTGGGAVDGADAAPPAGDRYGRRLARLEAARGGHAGSCRSSSGSFPRARRRFRRFEAAGHAHRGARSGQSGHPAAHGSHSVGAPRRPAPGRPRRRAPSTPGPLLPTPGRRRRHAGSLLLVASRAAFKA